MTKIKKDAELNPNLKGEIKAYIEHKHPLYNLSVILGSAGSGKTIGVTKVLLDMIKSTGTKFETIFVAKEQEQADKIKNNASPSSRAYTVSDFLNLVYKENVSPDSYTFSNSHLVSSASFTPKETAFDKNAEIKLIIVDEIETISEAELTRICGDAVKENAFVIGMGDLKQPSTSFKAKKDGNFIS